MQTQQKFRSGAAVLSLSLGLLFWVSWMASSSSAAILDAIFYFQIAQLDIGSQNANANDQIGFATAIDGDWAAVSSVNAYSNGGAVYVFQKTNGVWMLNDILRPSDLPAAAEFGFSIDLDGSVMLIGAPKKNGSTGAVYVFERSGSTWSELEIISGSPFSEFGYAIDLDLANQRAVIGSPRSSTYNGLAAIYTRNPIDGSWSFTESFAPSSSGFKLFGSAVALDNASLLVGSRGDSSVYAYTDLSGWSTPQVITDAAGTDFGAAIGIDGNTAVVGAPFADSNTGKAIVYRKSGESWTLQQTLTPSIPRSDHYFGRSVAVEGIDLIVGAHNESELVSDPGGDVFAFEYSDATLTWSEIATLAPQDRLANDRFGFAVDLSDGNVVVGAPGQTIDSEIDAGSAYLFSKESSPWEVSQPAFEHTGQLTYDELGYSVAIDGSTAIYGMHRYNAGGKAYVADYENGSWQISATIEPTGYDEAGWGFANAVALDGGTAVIGSHFGNWKKGAVFIFDRNINGDWDLNTVLTPPDTQNPIEFGTTVALEDNVLVIGVPFAERSDNDTFAGAIYIYERFNNVWRFHQKIINPSEVDFSRYASSIAIDDGMIVVGAPTSALEEFQPYGAAYVYHRPAGAEYWTLMQELVRTESEKDFDGYGDSVDIENGLVAVGASSKSFDTGSNSFQVGGVYLYRLNGSTWELESILRGPDTQTGDGFGSGVALASETVLVSSYDRFHKPENDKVHAFTQSGSGWELQAVLQDQVDGFSGFSVSTAIEGPHILVGAPDYDFGRIHFYQRDSISQTISFPMPDGVGDPNAITIGDTFPLSATIDSDNAIMYKVLTPKICTLSGPNTVEIISIGLCTIRAYHPGDAAYGPAEADVSFGRENAIFVPMVIK